MLFLKINDKKIMELGENLIAPFNPDFLTPNGYDLSINEVQIGEKIFKLNEGDIKIPPNTFFRVMTREKVKIPDDMIAELWLRSTYARKGVQATFGLVDAGFEGTLALSLFNSSDKTIIIKKDEKPTVCQIVFEKISGPSDTSYDKRSGNYQNQSTFRS